MALFTAKTPAQIDFLMNNGEDINYQDYYGQTLLHVLVQNDQLPELIDYILEKGANVHIPNHFGRTPIFYAKSTNAVQKLRINGAKIFARDHPGQTAIRANIVINNVFARLNKTPKINTYTNTKRLSKSNIRIILRKPLST